MSRFVLPVLAVLVLAACGRKGDPIPPPSKAPAAVSDLVATQQGPEIVLRFSYPSVTESGLPLTEIEGLSVLSYQRTAPELVLAPLLELDTDREDADPEGGAGEAEEGEVEAETPQDAPEAPASEASDETALSDSDVPRESEEPAPETEESGLLPEYLGEEEDEDALPPLPQVDQRTFESLAGVILQVDGQELGRYVEGNQVLLRLRDEEFRSDPWIHAYAVVVRANGRNSRPSNIAVVNPVAPPEAVTSAEVEGSEEGIRITWQLLDDETVTGYNVYRRSADESVFSQPVGTTPPDQAWFVDTAAAMGERWVYAVTALGARGVESGWGNQREIFYRDVYPPPAPTALVAIPDAEGIRLLWRHQPPDDHAGYVVIRSRGEVSQPLNQTPVTGLEFTDRSAESGGEYVYYVTAVDQTGNASEASEPVTVIAP